MVESVESSQSLGADEQALLHALKGTGELGRRLKEDLKRSKGLAKYKLEIQFSKARSSKLETPNTAVVVAWESGRRFHGGGDQRMAFCGYWSGQGYYGEDECMAPIEDKHFGMYHTVCPTCQREQFLDPLTKKQHLLYAQREGKDLNSLAKLPVANPSYVVNLTPKKMAKFIAKRWHSLGGNADLYVKYHPTDIRCYDVDEVKKPDVYEKARRDRTERKENRGLVVYPLANIIKDILAGAEIEGRFLALLLA